MTDEAGDDQAADRPWYRRDPDRLTRWDRPPPPKDWRYWVGLLGRCLIVTGVLMFLFVGYQLWGTGIETARAQNRLHDRFDELVAETTTTGATTTSTTTVAAPPTPTAPSTPPATQAPVSTVVPAADQSIPNPADVGNIVGQLQIPSLGLDDIVISGVTAEALHDGPGHFTDTPFPGQLGNAAIAGHRTTWGAPFSKVPDLAPGDDITVTLLNGHSYTYVVTGQVTVSPSDYHVISDSDPERATLTLITCTTPSASQRIAVFADLDPARSGPIGEAFYFAGGTADDQLAPALDDPPPTTASTAATVVGTAPPASTEPVELGSVPSSPVPTSAPTTDPPPADIVTIPPPTDGDAFSEGWFHDRAAWPHVVAWGLALVVIAFGASRLSRRTRHDSIGIAAGVVPFVICLYFFFQNVNRLLPPGL